MATESTGAENVIDQRWDALDRVLLGLLPRNERLAIVADVETRVRGSHEANSPAALAALPEGAAPLADAAANQRPTIARRRSVLAVTAGVLGIVSLVLLVASPIMYLVIAATFDAIGETTTYLLLSASIVTVALGGAAAVVIGITALVQLNRRPGTQRGHGWAIPALCTGPLPTLVGGLGIVTMVLPMMGAMASEFAQGGSPSYTTLPVVRENCTICPISTGGLQLPQVASHNDLPITNYQPGQIEVQTPVVTSSAQLSPAALPARLSGSAPAAPVASSYDEGVAPMGLPPSLPRDLKPAAATEVPTTAN